MATVDIQAFRMQPNGLAIQVLADATSSGETVSSSNKLAQRFLTRLLTPIGSIPYAAKRGSSFINRLKFGGIATDRDVFVAFAAAQTDLSPSLKQEETDADPPEERFAKAVLSKLTIRFGAVDLQIDLSSQAASTQRLLLPLSFQLQ